MNIITAEGIVTLRGYHFALDWGRFGGKEHGALLVLALSELER